MDIDIRVEDKRLYGMLGRYVALGKSPAPFMRAIATIGENTTRERFRTETSPEGVRWKKSLRAQVRGTRTLTKDGHLSGSISSKSDAHSAEWGVNRIYAAIHQFGGTIRAKDGGSLRFRLANGAWATVDEVRMPARPFLGVNDRDADEMLDAGERLLQEAFDVR